MKVKPLLRLFHIHDGNDYWYVAPTKRAATAMFVKDNSYPHKTVKAFRAEWDFEVTQMDDDAKLTITNRAEDTGEEQDETKTLTAHEWTEEWGPGLLAQSDF